jgi:hypothetical protein
VSTSLLASFKRGDVVTETVDVLKRKIFDARKPSILVKSPNVEAVKVFFVLIAQVTLPA